MRNVGWNGDDDGGAGAGGAGGVGDDDVDYAWMTYRNGKVQRLTKRRFPLVLLSFGACTP